jgi:hypothetical protein
MSGSRTVQECHRDGHGWPLVSDVAESRVDTCPCGAIRQIIYAYGSRRSIRYTSPTINEGVMEKHLGGDHSQCCWSSDDEDNHFDADGTYLGGAR